MESFQGPHELEKYRRKICMENATVNFSDKYGYFGIKTEKGNIVKHLSTIDNLIYSYF